MWNMHKLLQSLCPVIRLAAWKSQIYIKEIITVISALTHSLENCTYTSGEKIIFLSIDK